MASRKEEKERLRQQRLEAEKAEKAQQRRRLLTAYIAAGVLGALVVAGIVIAVANNSGGGGSSSAKDVAKQQTAPGSVPAAAEAGTTTKPPPWPPVYPGLADRISAMGLPGLSDTIFHIHAILHVYVNGKPVTVPANVGLDQATGTFSPLHTHDTSGIVHMEATKPYPFTLGQFFSVWGVRFSKTQLGPFKPGNGNVLQVYLNGKPVSNPVDEVMHEHDDISVGYGKPGSFPRKPPAHFPAGL
jgi:hypothetical protein